MSAKTKIVVLHMKKLLLTGILTGIGILLLIFLFMSLRTGTKHADAGESVDTLYVPGVYTSSVMIDQNSLDI